MQQLSSWKGNVLSKDQSSVFGKGSEGNVQGLVYTARVLVTPHILSVYEGLEGNSQKLEENGRK